MHWIHSNWITHLAVIRVQLSINVSVIAGCTNTVSSMKSNYHNQSNQTISITISEIVYKWNRNFQVNLIVIDILNCIVHWNLLNPILPLTAHRPIFNLIPRSADRIYATNVWLLFLLNIYSLIPIARTLPSVNLKQT